MVLFVVVIEIVGEGVCVVIEVVVVDLFVSAVKLLPVCRDGDDFVVGVCGRPSSAPQAY